MPFSWSKALLLLEQSIASLAEKHRFFNAGCRV